MELTATGSHRLKFLDISDFVKLFILSPAKDFFAANDDGTKSSFQQGDISLRN